MQLADRVVELSRLGDGELDVVAEHTAQLLRLAGLGRVGDRDEQQVVSEETHRQRLVPEGKLLLEQPRSIVIRRDLGQVHVLEPELVGERLCQVGARDPTVPDRDLTETAAGQVLLLKGLLELLEGEQAAVDQQRAEAVMPRDADRFHIAYIVVPGGKMKAVVQRVSSARVRVGERIAGEIGPGLCILLGIARGDEQADAERLAAKVARLRIFENEEGRFDRSLLDTGGEALVVSQFTLLADSRRQKGTKPDFSAAAPREEAEPIYQAFCAGLRALGVSVATGAFGERMSVEIANDGPVTIVLEL